MQTNPYLGVTLHAVGAFFAASCYTPQKQTKRWSWEIYWITQATFAWLILPIVVAFLTIPNYIEVLQSCPDEAKWNSFLLGVLYGFGGLTFGLGIRYIGFSLNYAIAIGISAGLGTIGPLIWDPNKGFVGKLVGTFNDIPGLIILSGIVLSWLGILICGWAGAMRERSSGASESRYSFKRGVPLAVMAGVLSAVFNYALIAGKPLTDAALKAGASDLLKMNAIYPFSHGGAWVTNLICCLILIKRNRTGSQFVRLAGQGTGRLSFYYLMALLSGAFWYFQFFFYGMGQSCIGPKQDYTSWALHMSMLILFSNVYGKLFREWEGASPRPRRILNVGMLIIAVSTLIMAFGSDQGKKTEQKQEQEASSSSETGALELPVLSEQHRHLGNIPGTIDMAPARSAAKEAEGSTGTKARPARVRPPCVSSPLKTGLVPSRLCFSITESQIPLC